MIEILKSIVEHDAFFPVASALMTLVITSIFELLKRQTLEKQMFFERFFPERVKAYNDLLEKLPSITKDLSVIILIPPDSRPKALLEIINRMNIDFYKQNLWLGREVVDLYIKAIDIIREPILIKNKYTLVELINNEEINNIISSFMKIIALLNKQIELSSGKNIIDNKFHQLTKLSLWKKFVMFVRGDNKKADKIIKKILSSPNIFNTDTK